MKFLRRLRDEAPLPVADEADAGESSAEREAAAPDLAPEGEAGDGGGLEVEAGEAEAREAQAPQAEATEAREAEPPEAEATEAPETGVPGAPATSGAAAALGSPDNSSPDEAEQPLPVASDIAEGDPDVDAGDAARVVSAAPASPTAEPERAPRVRAADAPRQARLVFAPDALSAEATGDGRPADLQLAGLHLRTGLHALARAELEALAGRGRLDETALLDLAEVRWRTGDLAGAGEAANALLARGAESPLALVIAAEAVAAAGRPGEARRLSTRAVEAADGPLDPIFAGMPRASMWPAPSEPERAVEPSTRKGRGRGAEAGGAPSTASEAFAGGRAALARGDSTRAALLLGVAMRLAPEFAEDVLRAVSGHDDQPLLALVRGDALRLLGRESEALEAFDRARGRAAATEPATRRAPDAGPGLFDDDPGATADD